MAKEKSKIIMTTPDFEKTAVNSISQAQGYIRSKDFHNKAMKKIEDMKNHVSSNPCGASRSAQLRALRTGLACLENKGKEAFYKKLLACRLRGASYIQIGMSMKMEPKKVEYLEKEAMKCLKSKLAARRITPVISTV